ncbi:hypothetical protein DL96DRAFT_1825367 [Flagelloscypha sp. PMI_526]|nr:hypothetical protein DL96DRAFT_1825367 [Flagelloscypha sp. PMI_526]
MPAPSHGIRVISFDGPALDATGLSELLILEDIAGKWAWDREDDDREGADIPISELCDIVGGTGIGGFYAILFSLNLTVGEVITSHKILQSILFSSNEWEQKNSAGCVDMLKTALTQIVEELGLEVDLDTPFLAKNSLKCFVCVLNDVTAGRPRALRNYRVRSSKSPRCSIREAIQAALADGVHLPPVLTQDEQFICASSGFPNPSYELMKELPAAFPKGSKLACFVNLGSGGLGILRITSGKHQEELAQRVRNAEEVAQNLVALCGGLGPCYFRFSVVTGVDGAILESANDVIRIVKSLTVGYLEEAEIGVNLDGVADALTKRDGVVFLERLGSLAAEDGKAKLNAQVEAVHNHVVRMVTAMENDIHRSVKNWLTPIDQTAKLDACIRARSSSTCGWLWDHPKVIEWKTTGGIFWCHAGMGTGKTIIASHVVETFKDFPEEYFVAYYYFEFTNPSTLSEEALFRSIVSQLSYTNEIIIRRFYEEHKNGVLQPQLKSLLKVLRELVVAAASPVYILVDALDELPLPRRRYLLETLLELVPSAASGVHVMVTSRDELDIYQTFSGRVSYDFAIRREMVHQDITTFVDQELAAKKWQSWPKQEVSTIRETLINKADGMFRLVACQIEVLNQTQSTEDMHQALVTLPVTLGDTYRYILSTIPSHLQTRAYTLLCVLCASFTPVSIEELSALVAVELGEATDPINLPAYHEGLRYHEPQNIIGLGTALVRRTTAYLGFSLQEEESLQLSHASVKEYLLQGTCSWCAVDDQLASETTARACLALLIHSEDPSQISGVADIRYSRRNWRTHISANHGAQLLSQQKKLFETYPWTRSSIVASLRYINNYGYIVESRKSPIIYAAATSLEQLLFWMLEPPFQWKIDDLNHAMYVVTQLGSSAGVLTALIVKGGDVNATTIDRTPILYNAVRSGQFHVVQTLVKYGANVNMNEWCGSALQAAVSQRALDVVKFLVESGADVNMEGKYGLPLQAAVSRRALDIVKLLVESGADVNMVGGWSQSSLQAAAATGDLDIVKFLVECGADVNMDGEYGSALQVAASHGPLDVVKFLVESGADVNMEGILYGSALQAAASNGALDVVQFLVERGANVNMSGGWDGSALQAATSEGALGVVEFLVESGADVNLGGGKYGSALQAAVKRRSLDLVRFLVRNGADMDMWGGKHKSALQIAAGCGALDIVKFLVENGADVSMGGGDYGSALQAAATWGDLNAVQFLVESGADLNMKGGYFGSALEAAERGSLLFTSHEKRWETVNFLALKGAVRSDGTSPLDNELGAVDSSTAFN